MVVNRSAEDQRRAAGLDLAELVGLAQEYELPLPVEPTRRVGAYVVHPTSGPGLAAWSPADARGYLPPGWWL